jgi:uncharacterized glyoxalase superfamily protein PhnB
MNVEERVNMLTVNKLTPVLLVPEIEPCLRFWAERLGFGKTVEVPEGEKLGFVILQKGGVELMYQSYASVKKDAPPAMQKLSKGPTYLYVEVTDLEQVLAAIEGAEVVMPVRTTFYGAKEVGVKDPAGHIVIFAQLGTAEPS